MFDPCVRDRMEGRREEDSEWLKKKRPGRVPLSVKRKLTSSEGGSNGQQEGMDGSGTSNSSKGRAVGV